MDKRVLTICLSTDNHHGGYFYADLSLPAKGYEILDTLQKLRCSGRNDDPLVSELRCEILPELSEVRLDAPTIKELDFFARRLAALSDGEQLALRGVFLQHLNDDMLDDLVTMKDLINMTYGLDQVTVAWNVGDDDALGQFVIENDLHQDVSAVPADEMFDKAQAEELKPLINQLYGDYDVRRAAMYMKLLRYSYASGGKAYGCQPFDMRKVFNLITQASDRLQNAVIENQDFGTLIKHYDDEKALIYCDPPYFSMEGMYDVGFGWDDHVRLRDTLAGIDGKFLLSYNDCPEIRQLYEGYPMFDFTRTHSMAQRYHPGKQFKELLIANYDLYERERAKPKQMSIFDPIGDLDDGSNSFDYERILKECILTCKVKK